MCSIIGSFSKDKIIELAELNAYRGEHSWSITYIHKIKNYCSFPLRQLGSFNPDKVHPRPGEYMIVHQQAPTTDNKSEENIHPAEMYGNLLWHNGILKEHTIKYLQEQFRTKCSWDTFLFLSFILKEDNLNVIDGSFSCVMYKNHNILNSNILLFRNEIAPLFIDEHRNISSTKFLGCIPVQPNVVWEFDPWIHVLSMTKVSEFKTVDNPYFFMD